MKYVLLVGYFFIANIVLGQENDYPKRILGCELGGTFFTLKDTTTNENKRLLILRLAPYLGVRVLKRAIIGGKIEREEVFSNFVDEDTLLGFGMFVRYYLKTFRPKKVKTKVLLYTEINYFRVNYYHEQEKTIVLNAFSENNFRLHLGINVKTWKNLYLDTTFGISSYFQGDYDIGRRIGVEYHF